MFARVLARRVISLLRRAAGLHDAFPAFEAVAGRALAAPRPRAPSAAITREISFSDTDFIGLNLLQRNG